MNDRVVMQFALITDGRKNASLKKCRFIQNHHGLVRVAGKNDIIECFCFSALVLHNYFRLTSVYPANGPVEVYLVPKSSGQIFVDAPRAAVPRLHRGRGFNIEELQITGKQGRGHFEHVGGHQEVDEHRLQYLVPKISGKPAEVENRTHAYVIERVESIEQSGPGPVEPTKPPQAFQEPLEFRDFRLQLPPDIGIEIMGIDAAAILHAVAEFGIDQFDTVLLHEQKNVVVDRRNACSD